MKMEDIAKNFFKTNGMKKLNCCICGCDFYGCTGNNPWPIADDGVCCHDCNFRFVIPARLAARKEADEKGN